VLTRADSTGTWHLIVVGPLRSSEEAEFAQKTLARQGFSGTKVTPIARGVPQ
jgi:cell division protein FtsN